MKINYKKLITTVTNFIKHNKITQDGFADLCGLTQGGLNKILSGKRASPDIDTVSKIISGLKMPISEFLIFEDGDNMDIIEKPKRYVPLISWIDAGRWEEILDINYVGVGEPIPYYGTDKSTFALIVTGDSMEDEFFAGDIVLISPNSYCENGNYCVVQLGERATLKKIIRQKNIIILRALNKKYDDIFITKKDKNFRVVGKVVQKTKKY